MSRPHAIEVPLGTQPLRVEFFATLDDVPSPAAPESRYFRDGSGGVFALTLGPPAAATAGPIRQPGRT
jgi:hypothetical protein